MRTGAGKSTTMRIIMDLDRPDAGQVRIGGKSYRDLRWPLREAGALLEARYALIVIGSPGSMSCGVSARIYPRSFCGPAATSTVVTSGTSRATSFHA
jgi:ABC-2 type transport system ATP-binding protein